MAGIRAGLGVLVASMVLAPTAAWACEEHDPDERERVAGLAGDSVSIEIPNTLEGAEWAIRLKDADDDDDPLAKGEDESAEDGVEAEFDVPDLGEDEREVDLVVAVTHEADDADWSYEVELEYGGRPVAEPEPPKQAEPAPAPQPQPDERPPPAPDRTSDAGPAPSPAGSAAPPPPPAPVTPAQRATPEPPAPTPPRSVLLTGGKTSSPVGELLESVTAIGTGTAARVAEAARSDRGSARRRPRSRRRAQRPEPQAVLSAPARPRPHEAPAEGGIRLPDVDLPGLGSGLAWSLIAGGGLAFALAGVGVAGLGRHRRRRGLSSPV